MFSIIDLFTGLVLVELLRRVQRCYWDAKPQPFTQLRYLVLSVRFGGFRPAEATRCVFVGEFGVEESTGSFTPNFTPIGASVGVRDPKANNIFKPNLYKISKYKRLALAVSLYGILRNFHGLWTASCCITC